MPILTATSEGGAFHGCAVFKTLQGQITLPKQNAISAIRKHIKHQVWSGYVIM